MVIYQFVFFACYDLFDHVSLDRQSFMKAIAFVTILDIWVIAVIFMQLNLHYKALPLPPFSAVAVVCIALPFSSYYIFGYKDRWKEYAREFRRYSKKQLLVGRIAVAVLFLVMFAALSASLYQAQHRQLR